MFSSLHDKTTSTTDLEENAINISTVVIHRHKPLFVAHGSATRPADTRSYRKPPFFDTLPHSLHPRSCKCIFPHHIFYARTEEGPCETCPRPGCIEEEQGQGGGSGRVGWLRHEGHEKACGKAREHTADSHNGKEDKQEERPGRLIVRMRRPNNTAKRKIQGNIVSPRVGPSVLRNDKNANWLKCICNCYK